MGIPGLFTFCRNNGCYEEYDLVTLAKSKPNLEILVDFYGIEQHILEMTIKKLASKYRNEYLVIPGAEYEELINAFRDFHLMFANIGVKLVYIADGPKGLDKINQQQKEKSWIVRFERNMKVYKNYLLICKNPQSPLQRIHEKIVRPCLMSDLFKSVIKEEGGEIINLIYGEADYKIANMRKERDSWAVLTNDSDFFIFNDCPTIHIGFFDMKQNFLQGRHFKQTQDESVATVRPSKLIIGLTSDKILMQKLKLSSQDKLIDFSVLMGNDYTADFAESLRDWCGIKWKYDYSDIPHAMRVAEWVEKQPTNLIDSDEFRMFSEGKPELMLSVQFSMDFYKLFPSEPHVEFSSKKNEEFWNYLVERYQQGNISSMCLSVFHGFCYQRNCVQPIEERSSRDINSLLVSLKSGMYALFLQDGITNVTEYEVPNTPDYTRLIHIPASSVNLKSFLEKSDTKAIWMFFDKNWSEAAFRLSSESKSNSISQPRFLNYFNRFGTEIGFCCYCLRILWCVTKRVRKHEMDLVLTESDFRAVFCAVFFRLLKRIEKQNPRLKSLKLINLYPNDWFFNLKVCPSSACETTQEWLQIIYFIGYTLYGKSFNIAQYFPIASEFISGTVLASFFEYSNNNGLRIRNLDSKSINNIYEIMSTLFDEFGYIFDSILDPF